MGPISMSVVLTWASLQGRRLDGRTHPSRNGPERRHPLRMIPAALGGRTTRERAPFAPENHPGWVTPPAGWPSYRQAPPCTGGRHHELPTHRRAWPDRRSPDGGPGRDGRDHRLVLLAPL